MATTNPAAGDQQKVITGRVRFSYVYVTKPRANKQGVEKYSVVVLLPKSDKATFAKLKAAEMVAAKAKFPGKPDAFYAAMMKNTTIHDGDAVRPASGDAFGPECAGHWVFNAATNNRPGCVDENLQSIIEEPIKSGDYGRASLRAYGYDNEGKKGVTFGLNNLQLLERGESLSGQSSAEDDFAEF